MTYKEINKTDYQKIIDLVLTNKANSQKYILEHNKNEKILRRLLSNYFIDNEIIDIKKALYKRLDFIRNDIRSRYFSDIIFAINIDFIKSKYKLLTLSCFYCFDNYYALHILSKSDNEWEKYYICDQAHSIIDLIDYTTELYQTTNFRKIDRKHFSIQLLNNVK